MKAPNDDGDYPYYSTYGERAVKEYYPHKWPCCSGTLVQGVADYVLNIYFQAANALYVNLFVPSRVTWRRGGYGRRSAWCRKRVSPMETPPLFSMDLIHAAGGGIMGHPGGVAAGVRSLREAWEAAVAGISLEEYARSHPDLKASLQEFAST